MTTLQKIEKLNEACDGSLGFDHHPYGWEIYSYKSDSPLSTKNHHPYFTNTSLEKLIDEAYSYVFEQSEQDAIIQAEASEIKQEMKREDEE